MPGGGISLPVSIAQMGNVARTQAQGQQAAQQNRPVDPGKDLRQASPVERVKETGEAEKNRIQPDEENLDNRQRRRLNRRRKRAGEEEGPDRNGEEAGGGHEDGIGTLVDCRV